MGLTTPDRGTLLPTGSTAGLGVVGGELALLSPQHVPGVLPNSVNVHAAPFTEGETEARGAYLPAQGCTGAHCRARVWAQQPGSAPLNVMPATFYGFTDTHVPQGPRRGKTWLPCVGRDHWRYPTAEAPPCPALFWAVVQHVSGQHTKLQSQKPGRTAAPARRAGVSERQAGGQGASGAWEPCYILA